MAPATSTAPLVYVPPPPNPMFRELAADERWPEPPTEIPPLGEKLVAEDASTVRVAIWRAEVNACTLTCACSLVTLGRPATAWCPSCLAPLEGVEYARFKDGHGLARLSSRRRSIANVWPLFSPRDSSTKHRHRLEARGSEEFYSVNEFAVLGNKFLAKTRLNRVFRNRRNEPYVRPEYGDVPGSVAELEPEYDPPEDPNRLTGPGANDYAPAREDLMRRHPPARLGVINTEMYRSLRVNPIFYYNDRPSVSSLMDEWSSSDAEGKPKLTINANTARLIRAQILLYKTYGPPATCPSPGSVHATPSPGTISTPG
ncbi:hypothetical protein PG994_010588 [Apiospora phragmitis]|uniref:Uncharacterized protein n=1 Tax=Apiospora phragmitis TaxID=2905665 RepID=A0ABR1TT15_9PEZI